MNEHEMNESEIKEAKDFFQKRLGRDAEEFVNAVCRCDVDLAVKFVQLAYVSGVRDGIREASTIGAVHEK